MFCKQCGNELKDGAMFCTNCGANQGAAAPAQPVEQDLEKTVGVFDAMPGAQQAQPVAETPVQPVVETPVQPVVETPAQPVQQPVQQPVYQAPIQQPVQPTYQAPVQQQNAYNPNAGETHNGKVGFGEAIKLFFKNYVNFSGRASKSEYWWVFLFNILMYIPIALISSILPPLGGACSIALMIPGISLAVRRLHDTGKPGGWWFMGLIPLAGGIILLIQFLKDSDGDNEWGPGPVAPVYGSGQFVNTPVSNAAPAQRVVTDNDIYAMAQNHEPVNLNDSTAKGMLDAALSRIVPTYTGMEDLAGAMMLCDPQSIKANIAATDTDNLLVIFKALGYYIGQGGDANVLGMVQQNVLATLKTRF